MMNLFFSSLGSVGIGGSIPTTNEIDLFIFAGQSNIDGRNNFTDRPTLIDLNGKIPNTKVWYQNQFYDFQLGQHTGYDIESETRWSFDVQFLSRLITDTNIKPWVVKRTKGGTGIAIGLTGAGSWNVDFDSIDEGDSKLTQELGNKIVAVKNYLALYNKTFRFRAFIWLQGETDGRDSAAAAAYYQNFKDVISYIRGVVGENNLPVIFGTVPYVSSGYSAVVRNAQLQIASEDSNAYVVDLSDVTLQDASHFDAAGSILAGNRYADIFINNNL